MRLKHQTQSKWKRLIRHCFLAFTFFLVATAAAKFANAQTHSTPTDLQVNNAKTFGADFESPSALDCNEQTASIVPQAFPVNRLSGIQPAAMGAMLQSQTQTSFQPDVGLNQSLYGDFRSLWKEAHQAHRTTGFIDFNTYWDSRHFANTTINLLANLPNDFQYFQLLNLDGALDSDSHDLTMFFTEMNLRRAVAKDNPYLKPLDWTIQYADGTVPHGVLRFGFRWRMQDTPNFFGAYFKETFKLNYSVNFHLVETDGSGWQIEHVYRRDFFNGEIYVAGFCDHNINDHGCNSTWVTEHQVGLQVFDSFYVVAEHRYNSFLPSGSRQGLGVGLEYVMRFKCPK